MTRGQRDFLLASMRVASANLRTWQLELDEIGIALRNDMISDDEAEDWLDEIGLLRWLPEPANPRDSTGTASTVAA